MHYIIQIRVLVIRLLTFEMFMQLILLSMIQVLFFHALKLLALLTILPIVQLLTIY